MCHYRNRGLVCASGKRKGGPFPHGSDDQNRSEEDEDHEEDVEGSSSSPVEIQISSSYSPTAHGLLAFCGLAQLVLWVLIVVLLVQAAQWEESGFFRKLISGTHFDQEDRVRKTHLGQLTYFLMWFRYSSFGNGGYSFGSGGSAASKPLYVFLLVVLAGHVFSLFYLFARVIPSNCCKKKYRGTATAPPSTTLLRVLSWGVVATGLVVLVLHIVLGTMYFLPEVGEKEGLVPDQGLKYHLVPIYVAIATIAVTLVFLGPRNIRVMLFCCPDRKDEHLHTPLGLQDEEHSDSEESSDESGSTACGKFWCRCLCSGSCASVYLLLLVLMVLLLLVPFALVYFVEDHDDPKKIMQVTVNLDRDGCLPATYSREIGTLRRVAKFDVETGRPLIGNETLHAGFETADSIYVPDDGSITPILWTYWGQGLAKAPCLVRRAYLSWLHAAQLHATKNKNNDPNKSHWRVVQLDAERHYVAKKDLDSIALYVSARSPRFTDLVRLALLERFGGVWVDATLMPTFSPEDSLFSGLGWITERFRGHDMEHDQQLYDNWDHQKQEPPSRPKAEAVDFTGSGGVLTAVSQNQRFSPNAEFFALNVHYEQANLEPNTNANIDIPLFESFFIAAAPKSQFVCLWKMEFQEMLVLGTDAQIRKTTSEAGPLQGKGRLEPNDLESARYLAVHVAHQFVYLAVHVAHQFVLQSYAHGVETYYGDPGEAAAAQHFRLSSAKSSESAFAMHNQHDTWGKGLAGITKAFTEEGPGVRTSSSPMPKYVLKLVDAGGMPDFYREVKDGSYAQRTLWPLGLPEDRDVMRQECDVEAKDRTEEAKKAIAEERKKLVGDELYAKLEEF
eukprot:g8941.t1